MHEDIGSAAARYSRQTLFPKIGNAGQDRLLASRVVIVGCGALGASLAEMAARAGIGTLVLVDRDIVETSNLGRQALYTSADAAAALPKAAALAHHLAAINPGIRIEAKVADLNAGTIAELLDGADLVLDGTDNLEARYLLNDWAVMHGRPWVYGACVAARGLTAPILPGTTPCLRCLFPEPPPPGSLETCDTAGIIAPAATLVASLQLVEALKILVGDVAALRRTLLSVELWPFRVFELGGASSGPLPDCPTCAERRFDFLAAGRRGRALTYCGRDAVQIVPAERTLVDLEALERRIGAAYPCRRNGYVLIAEIPPCRLTIFDDGRALVSGTGDPGRARALYDRVVGS